jgi:N-acetylmuramic acid 6-phosphate etherase
MQWTGLDAVSGQDLLNQHQGQLRQAVLSWNLP